MTSYLQNKKSYQPQILHEECFYGYNDSCKVSFQSVDVNLDFCIWAFEPPSPRAWRTTEKAGPRVGLKQPPSFEKVGFEIRYAIVFSLANMAFHEK